MHDPAAAIDAVFASGTAASLAVGVVTSGGNGAADSTSTILDLLRVLKASINPALLAAVELPCTPQQREAIQRLAANADLVCEQFDAAWKLMEDDGR